MVKLVLPNLIVFFKGRLKLSSIPRVNQTMLLSGYGNVFIGKNCAFGYKLGGFHRRGLIELQARNMNSVISVGNNVSTNNNLFICAANSVEIGNDTLIGQNVTIMDHEAHCVEASRRREIGEIGYVTIGKNVWIGNGVTILKNSSIGDNTVVAAGAIVTGTFPDNVIIGGVPAKIIRTL